MFAILICHENLQKIKERVPDFSDDESGLDLDTYLKSHKRWYAVTGYVTRSEKYFPFTTLPEYYVKQEFDYDPEKIDTDWDQIVRK